MKTNYYILIRLWLLMAVLFFSNQSFAENFRFTGEVSESTTNTVYLRNRSYDPETGTFINKDPLGLSAGVNSFSYCNNNPVNATDPNGTLALADTAIAAGVGAGVGIAGRAIGDVISVARGGHWSTWQQYTGSAVGGAVFGAALTVNPFAATSLSTSAAAAATAFVAGGAGSAVSNTVTQNLNIGTGVQQNFNYGSLAIDTSVGAVFAGGTAAIGSVGRSLIQQNLSTQIKGNIGEAVGTLANLPKGNIPSGFQVLNEETHSIQDMVTVTGKVFELKSVWGENGIGSILSPRSIGTLTAAQQRTAAQEGANYIAQQVNMAYAAPILSSGVGFAASQALDVGGVLIDKAATLVGSNLSDIKGATYDPVSKQIIFLGSSTVNSATAVNMDYFYTAVQAVYGSAVPPFVSLDSQRRSTAHGLPFLSLVTAIPILTMAKTGSLHSAIILAGRTRIPVLM